MDIGENMINVDETKNKPLKMNLFEEYGDLLMHLELIQWY